MSELTYAEKAVEIHEHRLSGLESKVGECTTGVALAASDVKSLQAIVATGFCRIESQISDLFRQVLPAINTGILSLNGRVDALEKIATERTAKWSGVKKAAWALVLVLVGAAVKVIADRIRS